MKYSHAQNPLGQNLVVVVVEGRLETQDGGENGMMPNTFAVT